MSDISILFFKILTIILGGFIWYKGMILCDKTISERINQKFIVGVISITIGFGLLCIGIFI